MSLPAKKRRAALVVDMQTKTQPLQERSRQTFEAILAAAAEVLEEVGIERFSTNLVCRRAQLTPPALYRYFPNKYALLKELGARLMEAQDQAVFDWIDSGGVDATTPEEALRRNLQIHNRVNDITRQHPGALWILRALRAVPTMREVRIASRTQVAERLFHALKGRYPRADEQELRRGVRLNLELAMAVTEMTLEEPDSESDEINAAFIRMIVQFYERFA
jgi:AcrR family transcriptional regulator